MADPTDNRRTEDLESDIAQTRADFSDTIDAIQSKLTPRELKKQAVDYALNTTPGAFGANLVNTVRDNPVPVVLIGVGIAWLMAARKQSSQYMSRMHNQRALHGASAYPEIADAYYEDGMEYASGAYADNSDEGMLHRAASRTGQAASELKHKASDVGHRLGDTAAEMSERARQARERARGKLQETAEEARARLRDVGQRSQAQYYRAKDRVDRMLDEQPLVVGALGVALGAALGAALPTTRRENELMGRTRDDLLEKAKETARAQAETVKQSAQRLAQTAKQEANRVKDDMSNAASQGMDQSRSRAGTSGNVDINQFGGSSISGQQLPH